MKQLVLALALAAVLSSAVQAQEKECPDGQVYNPQTEKCEVAP